MAVVKEETCKGCESIVDCCPFGAIYMKDGKSHVDWEKCMGCGVCESKCPNHARLMMLDERKGIPMDVRKLEGTAHQSFLKYAKQGGGIVRESTKVLMKKHGWRVDRAIHNYFYFRWYYPYVKTVSLFLKPLNYITWFKPLKYVGNIAFSRYHAKFISFGDAKKIFTLNQDVRLVSDENKRIVPYKYAHKIIFQDPEYVAVMDCPCKKSFNAPPETINSCIVVGKRNGEVLGGHLQKV